MHQNRIQEGRDVAIGDDLEQTTSASESDCGSFPSYPKDRNIEKASSERYEVLMIIIVAL